MFVTICTDSIAKINNDQSIHQLSNDVLIAQAKHSFDKSTATFKQYVRAYSHMTRKIRKIQKIKKKWTSQQPNIETTHPVSVKKIKKTINELSTYIQTKTEQLQLTKTEILYFKKKIHIIKQIKQSIDSVLINLDALYDDQLEVVWRIRDGTLVAGKRPKLLTKKFLKAKQKIYTYHLKVWKKREYQITKEWHQISANLIIIENEINDRQHQLILISKKHRHEIKRIVLEKQFQSKKTASLYQQLKQLQAERHWFQGAYNLAIKDYKQVKQRVEKNQNTINQLIQPVYTETIDLQQLDDIQVAIEQLEKKQQYDIQYEQYISKLIATLQHLAKQSQQVIIKAEILENHLFQMEVLSKVLQNKKNTPVLIKSLTYGSLSASSKRLEKTRLTQTTIQEEIQQQLSKIKQQKIDNLSAQKTGLARVAELRKNKIFLGKENSLSDAVLTLAFVELNQHFQETSKGIKITQKQRLSDQRKYAKTHSKVDNIILHLAVLDGPFLQQAIEESREQKKIIRHEFYQFADLNLEKEKSSQMETTNDSLFEDEKKANEKTINFYLQQLEKQQKLLSRRLHADQQQKKNNEQLMTAMSTLLKELDQYIASLKKNIVQLQQNYSIAVEIQKRFGREEVKEEVIPESLAEALQKDDIYQLKNELSTLLNEQNYQQQQFVLFKLYDPNLGEEINQLQEIVLRLGKRISDLNLAQKNQHNRVKVSLKKETPSQLKSLKQVAIRKAKKNNSWLEYFFSVFPSERADALTELLLIHYQDELNLIKQTQYTVDTKKAIQSAILSISDSQPLIAEFKKTMQQRLVYYELMQAQIATLVKTRIKPKQTIALFQQFAEKSKQTLPMPIPIPIEDIAKTVHNTSEQVYQLYVQQIAAQKWERYAEQLQKAEFNHENQFYLSVIGALEGIDNTLRGQLEHLQGSNRINTDLPFGNGEIGRVRQNRYQMWREKANWVSMEIVAILCITILLHLLVNYITSRSLLHYKKSAINPQQLDKYNKMQVLLPFTRAFAKVILWMLAIIITLSTLGFDIAAIIAGLGIGGFAIAMALKDTMSDLIGGINILLSGAFKVGDRIQINGDDAIVKDIGLRYTKLAHFSYNYTMIVPNALVINAIVINASGHSGCTILINIELSILNHAENIKQALSLIEKVVQAHENTRFIWVKHDHFDGHAFVLRLHYDIHQFKDRAWVESEINVNIVQQLQKYDIQFAHKIQTGL